MKIYVKNYKEENVKKNLRFPIRRESNEYYWCLIVFSHLFSITSRGIGISCKNIKLLYLERYILDKFHALHFTLTKVQHSPYHREAKLWDVLPSDVQRANTKSLI